MAIMKCRAVKCALDDRVNQSVVLLWFKAKGNVQFNAKIVEIKFDSISGTVFYIPVYVEHQKLEIC